MLLTTIHEYSSCFNAVAARGFNTGSSQGVELHKLTYYSLRATHPTLPAQLVVSSRMKAAEALKSVLTFKRKGRKVRVPHAELCPIRYDMRSYWVRWGARDEMGEKVREAARCSGRCSLATVAGRMELGFSVHASARRYITGCGKIASADLIYKPGSRSSSKRGGPGRWRLHVVINLPAPQIAPSEEVVGVDLGLVRPAVTSNNRFFGQRNWREQEARIFRLRRKLQAKGTRSAKRHLRKLSGKLFRQRRDHDHVLSRRIVNSTPEGGTIVLEKLTGIRGRVKHRQGQQSRRVHSWSFAQLQRFTRYKGEERGQGVALVDPCYTSQRCSRCGHTTKANRPTQAVFCCLVCTLQLNADLNAARNVATKYQDFGFQPNQAGKGKSHAGGPPSSGLLSQPASVG